jgi:beta-lactamase regulating signal transducer with metallopeptidase domain
MTSEAMTSWKEILDEPLFRKLSLVLLHFLWQAALVALVYAGLDFAARRRGARSTVRYALACAALAVMVALPVRTFAASGHAAASAEVTAGDPSGQSRSAFETAGTAMTSMAGDAPARLLATFSRWTERAAALRPFCMAAWLAGVAALSLRLVLGWTVATRLTHRGAAPARPDLVQAMARLARRLSLSRPVRLLESAAVGVPVAIGVLRPAILLPMSGLTGLSAPQIEALLAHELAHVRRNDYFVNLLQSVAETLFFYHPAVWWVSGRIRAERENCCDDLAISVTGDAHLYACALVDLEERRGGRRALAVAADGGDLLRRVARLFPAAAVRTPGHTRRVAGGVALSAILLTGAALRVGPNVPASMLAVESGTPAEETAPSAVRTARPKPARAVPAGPGFVRASRGDVSPSDPTPPPDEGEPEINPSPASDDVVVVAANGTATSPSPDEKTDSGALTLDEIRSLRVHNVTPEFIAKIRALGYDRATVDELVSLRIHGVSPDSIAAFQKLFGRISLERAVEFAIHGVTPDFVEEMRNAGLRLSAEQAVSMRIHGATPEFVRAIKDAGFGDVSPDGVVSLRIHGVDVAFAREMRTLGFADASLDELTSFRIHGVTPEFVRQVNAAGLTGLSADEATSLRIHGVTPEFLREVKGLKVRVESADDATSLRIHGVTTSFIQNVEAEGYSKPTVDDLTSLRIHGVTVEDIRRINHAAGRKLALEDIVDEKIDGGERSIEWNR